MTDLWEQRAASIPPLFALSCEFLLQTPDTSLLICLERFVASIINVNLAPQISEHLS